MTLIRQKDMAAQLGVSVATLKRWDCPRTKVPSGRGLRPRWLYDPVKVEAWLNQQQPKQKAG